MKDLKIIDGLRYHPRYAKIGLIYLGFVDDLLLFCKGDVTLVALLQSNFQFFSTASSLKDNIQKNIVYFGGVPPPIPFVYFGGVPSPIPLQIFDLLGYSKRELPFRYLGVSLSTKRLDVVQCEPLIEKILGRVNCWTSRFLSYAGRPTLVKSSLFSIQTFWAQIFILPT